VFGGVERESGKTFLIPVPDRTADTLKVVINVWIEPGTTVISNCCGAYRDLDTHHTLNHSIGFVDQRTGAHTNTIKSTRRHVKAFPSPYNRQGGLHLPSRSLHVRGEAKGRESGPIHKIPSPRRHNGLNILRELYSCNAKKNFYCELCVLCLKGFVGIRFCIIVLE
jgi:hypothetical protein